MGTEREKADSMALLVMSTSAKFSKRHRELFKRTAEKLIAERGKA